MTEQDKAKQAMFQEKFVKMPMGEEKARVAVKVFMQNPYFKEEYQKYTDKVKELEKWSFYNSLLEEDEGKEVDWVHTRLEEAKRNMEKADWENLIENTEGNMSKGMYRKQAEEYLRQKR